MGKGLALPRIVTNDPERLIRVVLENFRATTNHINGYVPSYDENKNLALEGTLSVPGNLTVTGNIVLDGHVDHVGGPEFSHMYRTTSSQAITATTWTPVQLNAVQGTSGTIFTEDTVNFEIDFSQAGIYMLVGQVEFDAAESGYLRLFDGAVEVGRTSFNTRLTGQVAALVAASAASSFKMEVWTDTAANVTVGSNSSYLKVARLFFT